MVRYEDSPGLVKHVRFGKVSDDALTALRDFPGVKAIVLHTHGKTGEHPHWHVWVELTEPATNQTIRNRLKRISAFSSYSGQNDWSFRNHDSWDAWSRYVIKNPTHKVLLNHLDLNELSEAANGEYAALVAPATAIEHVGAVAHVAYTVQKPRRKASMRELFIEHLRKIGWVDGCINECNYEIKKNDLIDELTDFWENAFTTPNGCVAVEHAMYEFADDGARDLIKSKNRVCLRKNLRC